jgi:dTDP-glucose 4,6-dehydratase
MRLLVTGGCGFVGSHFLRYVLQHYGPEMVTNVDSLVSGSLASVEGVAQTFGERYEYLRADVGDVDKIDAVLAAHHHFAVVNFTGESESGAAGLPTLLERARKHGVRRFLQVSTDRVAFSKHQAAVDELALATYRQFGEEVIVTRSARNYGPFQSPHQFIPQLVVHALREEPVAVPADGSHSRGWIHVEDHCSAIFSALLSGTPGAIYHLATDQKVQDLEVAHWVLDHLGKPRELVRFTAEGNEPEPGMDAAAVLAQEKLDWKPRKHFTDSLRDTVDWYVHHREWWESML